MGTNLKIKKILEGSKARIVATDKGMVVEGRFFEITPLLEKLIRQLYVNGASKEILMKIFENAFQDESEKKKRLSKTLQELKEILEILEKAN